MKNAGKAQRLHFEVGDTIFEALSQETLLLIERVFTESSVDTSLALVEVVATHGLSSYDVEHDIVVGVIAQGDYFFDQLLVTFGLPDNFLS